MEIPTWLFFSFWALTSTTFLHLGFHALDKTELNNSVSVSPLFMLFLKHSLAISSSSSSAYALKYRPQLTHQFPSPYFFIFYTILSSFLNKTTDGIILRATLITFYSQIQYFLHYLQSLLVPLLPILPHLKKIVLGIKITWLVFSLRGEIFSITYSSFVYLLLVLVELVSAIFSLRWLWDLPIAYSLFVYLLIELVKLVPAIFSLRWLCDLPFFFVGFLWFSFLVSLRFSWLFLTFFFDTALTLGTGDYQATAEARGRVAILMVLEISLFFVSVEKTDFYSPIAVVLLSHLIAAILAAASRFLEEDEGAWSEYLVRVKKSKMKKLIEFGVGVGGAMVFQKMFFAFTSWYEAAAFLCLGVMWLANLTLLGFPFDFGIFYFVVGSVVVGWCSWIVCAVALLLFCLRLKLESVDLVYEEDGYIQVAVF